MLTNYDRPATLTAALRLLREHGSEARLVAGGTDVVVELSRDVRPTSRLIDLTAIPDLRYLRVAGDTLTLGALATHNDVLALPESVERTLPLAQACLEVGAPQIRTRATVAGNLITASPANDTIPPLIALDASVVLANLDGERMVPLRDFYRGVRQTVLAPDELVREIQIPLLRPNQRGIFLKLGLRRAQAIAVINTAIVLTLDGDRIADAVIALGAVAPTIVRATAAERALRGQRLGELDRSAIGRLAREAAAPIDDVRGSAGYRRDTLASLVAEGLQRLANGDEAADWPTGQPLLDTGMHAENWLPFDRAIVTTINGRRYELHEGWDKTLLRLLRENAGLTGTKEGCAEGECGACTVWLNGQAVMSCLVPAPQAHGATITTIEGLGRGDGDLHPLQRAFIDHGAVQCGYCIPGMLMAGAKLLDEQAVPTADQVRAALAGNLCRCTGYRKILDAVLAAAPAMSGGSRGR